MRLQADQMQACGSYSRRGPERADSNVKHLLTRDLFGTAGALSRPSSRLQSISDADYKAEANMRVYRAFLLQFVNVHEIHAALGTSGNTAHQERYRCREQHSFSYHL